MVKEQSVKLECPKCKLPIEAKIKKSHHEFLIYICPKCQSNVVHYSDKIDIISDKLLRKLLKQKRLTSCGQIEIGSASQAQRVISLDDVTDLKIVLETSKNVDEFLSKI